VTDWARWYNLIYLLPAGVAVLVLLLAALGAADGDDGDAGAAADAGDLDGDGVSDELESLFGGAGQSLFTFLGVGRAPLSLVLGSLMLGWGLFGLAANEFLRPVLAAPARFIGPSLAVAAIGSLLTAKLFAEIAARVMPKDETYAIKREGLVGHTGTVIFPVTETGGRVHIRDQHRTLHQAAARVAQGHKAVPKGARVIVAAMHPEQEYLIVEPLGFKE
jgi:membrane protein implicated in regulation of membrane protease activity